MHKFLLRLQELRTLILAFRIIAFEKTDAVALIIIFIVSLPIILALLMQSFQSSLIGFFLAVFLYMLLRSWARKNRFRLIRMADSVEYADVDTADQGYRQHFETGVVLQRLSRDEMMKTGEYDPDMMEDSRWFYIVRSPKETRIVPFEWIVTIEIDTGEKGA